MKYFVYIIKSIKDNNIYIGFTNDLIRRLTQHNTGKVASTKHRYPFKMVYKEEFNSRKEAREREKYFKSGFGRELIKTSFFEN
jgi:putative endonuclease